MDYIFIDSFYLDDSKDIDLVNELFEIADKTGITFVLKSSYISEFIPKRITDAIIEFNKDKESGEVVATALDINGNEVSSRPFKHYKNDGIGYIE